MTRRPTLTTLSLPAEWDGCEHVVPCPVCEARGYKLDISGRKPCVFCQGRKVRWNRVSIPENMALRGYSVRRGTCYHGKAAMAETQVCANLWDSAGPTIPPPAPIDRYLLNGQVECPRCGEMKPECEVVQAYYCHHSLGMETEIIPCEDCREEMRDAVALVGGLAVAR